VARFYNPCPKSTRTSQVERQYSKCESKTDVAYGALSNDAACKRSNPERKKGFKRMKSCFLQKLTSRREMLRGSATLAGSAFLAHLFPAPLQAQQAPSAADLLAGRISIKTC
jgi:hypothetical protein